MAEHHALRVVNHDTKEETEPFGLRKKLAIIEVPVNYRGRIGESKITGSMKGTLKTGFRMIGLILRYRLS